MLFFPRCLSNEWQIGKKDQKVHIVLNRRCPLSDRRRRQAVESTMAFVVHLFFFILLMMILFSRKKKKGIFIVGVEKAHDDDEWIGFRILQSRWV